MKLTWYEAAKDGKRNLPPGDLFPASFQPSDSGSLFSAPKGKIYSPSDYGSNQVLLPEPSSRGIRIPNKPCPASMVAAARTRTTSGNGSRPSSRANPHFSFQFRVRVEPDRVDAPGQRGRPVGRGNRLRTGDRPDHQQFDRSQISSPISERAGNLKRGARFQSCQDSDCAS